MVSGGLWAQTAATMNTTHEHTTWEGQDAIRFVQSGEEVSSNVGGASFTFDRLLELDAPPGSDSGSWQLVDVKVRFRLQGFDQRITLTNNGGSDLTFNGTTTKYVLDHDWETFSVPTNTFDLAKPGAVDESDFFDTTLEVPNGTVLSSGGGVYDTGVPSGPLNTTNVEFDVYDQSLGGQINGFADYQGTGTFDFVMYNNPSFSGSGLGENIISSSNTGFYRMLAEVEYVVIPEAGTLTLVGIVFAGICGSMLVRRQRR